MVLSAVRPPRRAGSPYATRCRPAFPPLRAGTAARRHLGGDRAICAPRRRRPDARGSYRYGIAAHSVEFWCAQILVFKDYAPSVTAALSARPFPRCLTPRTFCNQADLAGGIFPFAAKASFRRPRTEWRGSRHVDARRQTVCRKLVNQRAFHDQ